MEKEKKKTSLKINLWQVLAIVFLVAFLISAYFNFSGGFVFTFQNLQEIGKRAIDYINARFVEPGTSASLKDVKFDSDLELYVVTTEYQGNEIPVYVTKNGKYLIVGRIYDLSEQIKTTSQSASQGIPKSDRPKVELYIFSYCPYGVQALGAFVEAAKFLKDYADFYVRFFSHMHGEFERQQNMIQECIIRNYFDKYWDYAKKFAEEVFRKCYGNITCDKEESKRIMQELGIDYNKIFECVQKDGEKYYNEDIQLANQLGLTGSPSFVINGVYVRNVVRTPEGIKQAVCSAFNNPPEICKQTLSTSTTQTTVSGSCG